MPDDEKLLNQQELEALLGGVVSPGDASDAARPAREETPEYFQLEEIASSTAEAEGSSDLNLILDVDLNVRVELGRSRLLIEDVIRLREGSVVPLDKLAGDPVDIFVNDRLMARGEVLVLNDNFCVRISQILGESSEEVLQDE